MKKSKKIILALGCLVSLSVFAEVVTELIYQNSGTAKFKISRNSDGQRWAATTSRKYDLYRDFSGDAEKLYLVEGAVTRSYSLDSEGLVGTSQWRVKTGDHLQTEVWNRSENATRLELADQWGLVISSLEGCCASIDGARAFNVKTGKMLLSFNDLDPSHKQVLPTILTVPNSSMPARYIGLITQDSTRDLDFVSPASGMEAAVLVKYASHDSTVYQKLQIDTAVASGWGISVLETYLEKDSAIAGSNSIEIQEGVATLWNIERQTDPQKVQGVRLVIKLNAGNGDKIIKIPVRKDRLSLSAAQIPSQVQIRAL